MLPGSNLAGVPNPTLLHYIWCFFKFFFLSCNHSSGLGALLPTTFFCSYLVCCSFWIFSLSCYIPVSPFLPNGIKTVLKAQNQVAFSTFCFRFWCSSFPFLCTNLYITPHPRIFFLDFFFAISEKAYS